MVNKDKVYRILFIQADDKSQVKVEQEKARTEDAGGNVDAYKKCDRNF